MRSKCASRRKNGEPCQAYAMNGADKCRMHLGKKTASVKAAYAAEQALARLDVPPVENPYAEMKRIAGQVVAWKDALAERVSALTAVRYQDAKGSEQLHAEVALLERAFDRCEKFLSAMARMDIDARQAQIDEAMAAFFIERFGLVLADLVLTPEQEARVQGAIHTHFAPLLPGERS